MRALPARPAGRFGLGRGAQAKIFPVALGDHRRACPPTIQLGVVRDRHRSGRDRSWPTTTSPIIQICRGAVLRGRGAGAGRPRPAHAHAAALLLAGAARVATTPLAKLAALVTALFCCTLVPQLVLFLGNAFAATIAGQSGTTTTATFCGSIIAALCAAVMAASRSRSPRRHRGAPTRPAASSPCSSSPRSSAPCSSRHRRRSRAGPSSRRRSTCWTARPLDLQRHAGRDGDLAMPDFAGLRRTPWRLRSRSSAVAVVLLVAGYAPMLPRDATARSTTTRTNRSPRTHRPHRPSSSTASPAGTATSSRSTTSVRARPGHHRPARPERRRQDRRCCT